MPSIGHAILDFTAHRYTRALVIMSATQADWRRHTLKDSTAMPDTCIGAVAASSRTVLHARLNTLMQKRCILG